MNYLISYTYKVSHFDKLNARAMMNNEFILNQED